MPDPIKLTKSEKLFFVDDGAKRGPMTMFRIRFHPGEPKLVCPHEIGWVRGFDVHPKGEHVVTGGSDRTLRLWKWTNGRPGERPATTKQAHDGWVEAVAFSPDGNQLATAGADALVKIWKTADLKSIKSLAGHTKYVCDVAFSPDGKLLVSGAEDGFLIVREATNFKEVQRIEFGSANNQTGQTPKHSGLHRLAISHDSRWLAAAGGEKLNVYDLASGDVVATEKLRMDVAFHPSAPILAGGDNETKVWACDVKKFAPPEKDKNVRSKSPGAIPGKVLSSIKRGDWSLGLRFSHDGKQLAMGKADGTVELYDVA
jgi:WD40 repeat protein